MACAVPLSDGPCGVLLANEAQGTVADMQGAYAMNEKYGTKPLTEGKRIWL